jgi:peptidoglycan/LPS O-acetylase OafA/YrhL
MRGIAAFAVVLYHVVLMQVIFEISGSPSGKAINRLLRWLPFQFFWDGISAVVLFFVLSGFVLSLPFYAGKSLPYNKYLIRRICRIYLPYLVAILIGMTLRALLYHRSVDGFAQDMLTPWSIPLTFQTFCDNLLLIIKSNLKIDPVTWSLTYEMRLSILFPIMMFLVLRMNSVVLYILSLVAAQAGWSAYMYLKADHPYLADWLKTTEAVPAFIAGALLAKHREWLVDRLLQFSKTGRLIILAFGICLYNYYWIPRLLAERVFTLTSSFLNYTTLTVGSAILVIWVLSSPTLRRRLDHAFFRFLGKISYSLYLYHMIIVLSLIYAFEHRIPTAMIVLLALILSLLIASVSYFVVEQPAIRLGRKLTSRQENPLN